MILPRTRTDGGTTTSSYFQNFKIRQLNVLGEEGELRRFRHHESAIKFHSVRTVNQSIPIKCPFSGDSVLSKSVSVRKSSARSGHFRPCFSFFDPSIQRQTERKKNGRKGKSENVVVALRLLESFFARFHYWKKEKKRGKSQQQTLDGTTL